MATDNIINFTEKRLIGWAKDGSGEGAAAIYRDCEGPKKEGVAGLCFVVQQKRRSFAFEGRIGGKSFRMVIGRHPAWSLGEARERAREIRLSVDRGEDPRLLKKQKAAANEAEREAIEAEKRAKDLEAYRAKVTVREVWEAYVDAKRDRWGARHLQDHTNLSKQGGQPKARGKGVDKPGVLASILSMPVMQINEEILTEWLLAESKTRANVARQGFEALRSCFRWASQHKDFKEVVPSRELFENTELLNAKPKRKAASATDVLERAHLADWFKAVQGISNKEISVYLQVLLLSGARRNELLELKWEHIDQRAPSNIWIKDKVEEEGRYVPLGPYALWLLNSLPKRKWLPVGAKKQRDVEWVFSGPEIGNARLHHDTPGAAHRRALSKVGLEVSLHGLRRSYASLSEWLEIPSGVVAQIQGHKASAVQERHYKRRPLELLAQSHCRFEAWVLEQAGIEFDAGTIKGGLRVVK